MSSVATMFAALPSEDKKVLLQAGIQILNAAPILALTTVGALFLSWQLEHTALDFQEKKLVRLSTHDTSTLDVPNRTPLMPPIQSVAIRLADAGSDAAEAAFMLAQKQIENTGSKGLIRTGLEFLFGGG